MESLGVKNVSYLFARDPSILAWNRAVLKRVNLEKELVNDNTQVSLQNATDDHHINVFLRIKGLESDIKHYEIEGNNLICKVPDRAHCARNLETGLNMTTTYTFSRIFSPDTTQIEIFNDIIKQKILDFINGRNSTIFTYGTSGSGKTYTIIGTPDQPGIIPRALEYIFRSLPHLPEMPELKPLPNGEVEFLNNEKYHILKQRKMTVLSSILRERQTYVGTYRLMQERLSIEKAAELDQSEDLSISVWVSFAEIYNENIFDLLDSFQSKKQRNRLKLSKYKDTAFIRNLTSINVVNGMEAFQLLQYGLHNLNYASTGLNSHSSRSHAIFTIKLVQYSRLAKQTQISCFNFCDLAGSERLKKTLNVGDRLKESNNINKSLHVLGRCIQSVKTFQKTKSSGIVPFRDSKLTQLFQNALMGNENISIIISLNPSTGMFEESRHALEFSAISKEIAISENPIHLIKIKNRFSEIIEKERGALPIANKFVENGIDEEKERLEAMVIQLSNEIEQLKTDKDNEIREEKEYVKKLYEKFIKNKVERDNARKELEKQRIKERYEDEIKSLKQYIQQLLTESEDIVNISGSSSEDSFPDKHNYSKENEELKLENDSLKEEIELLKSEKKEKERLESENKVLQNLMQEKEQIISDAKKCYYALEEKKDRIMEDNKNLILEIIKLKQRNEAHGMCYSCSCSEEDQ